MIHLDCIPEINLTDIIGNDFVAKIPKFDWIYEDGALPRDQLMVLLSLALYYRPAKILEIGTFMGQTTVALATCLPQCEIHTVDLPLGVTVKGLPGEDKHLVDRRDVGREFRGRGLSITQHLRDTLCWDFNEIGTPAPSFFFIDGSHTYEAVANDSEKCWGRARFGSIFIWHDCDKSHPGVVQFLSQWRMRGKDLYAISGTPFAYSVKR